MILVTGAGGFIGRHVLKALQTGGDVAVGIDPRWEYSPSIEWVLSYPIEVIFHLGAISDTTCEDGRALMETNVWLPQQIWTFCTEKKIPFIYASSAAVYGNGAGALNKYGHSKSLFDIWAEYEPAAPPHWYGLRFFNVYGTGEEHKGAQASLPFQFINGRETYFLPETKRDFIHVDDVVSVMLWMWKNKPESGIYDVGTGCAREIEELTAIVGGQRYQEIAMPSSLEGKYQFHTQADLTKLRAAGYDKPFLSLEEGIAKMLGK